MKNSSHWHFVSLEDVAEIQTGLSKSASRQGESVTMPYLRVANVQDGHFNLSEVKEIEVPKNSIDRFRVRSGDVLLTEGGDFDKLGRGAVWRGQIPDCVHQNHIFVVRPNPKSLDERFLAYQTQGPRGRAYFQSCSKQSTNLASINSSQLRQFPTALPPLPEQRKIADILSTWDESLETLDALINGKTHQKQARESDIRDLNKLILKEPFWKPAQTAEGKPSRKQIIPGDCKTSPNNVLTATGEMFEFAPPTEVPARMERLVKWLEASLMDGTLHPVMIAAKLHHDFVLIHPFDDGNGRVARMLVNYLFMRLGYPPIIVPTQEKAAYLAALRLANAGDLESLAGYLRQRLENSLMLAVKAGKGESVEEPGDVEKDIALFIRSQEHHKEKVRPKSAEAIKWIYENGIRDLLARVVEKMRIFDGLFVKSVVSCDPRRSASPNDVLGGFEENLQDGFGNSQFVVRFVFHGYRGEAKAPFNVETTIDFNFSDFEYFVNLRGQPLLRKLYSSPVFSDETVELIEKVQKEVFATIRKSSGQN